MDLIREYESGKTLAQLGEELGISAQQVARRLKSQGHTRRRTGRTSASFSQEEIAVISGRYEAGESANSIAKDYRVSDCTVARHLRLNGVTIRKAVGRFHGMWGGGRREQGGYIFVRVPEGSPFEVMRNASGYVAEHRLVMASYLERPLEEWETVHHINGHHDDNAIENLQLRVGYHGKHIAYRCSDCGSDRIIPVRLED